MSLACSSSSGASSSPGFVREALILVVLWFSSLKRSFGEHRFFVVEYLVADGSKPRFLYDAGLFLLMVVVFTGWAGSEGL